MVSDMHTFIIYKSDLEKVTNFLGRRPNERDFVFATQVHFDALGIATRIRLTNGRVRWNNTEHIIKVMNRIPDAEMPILEALGLVQEQTAAWHDSLRNPSCEDLEDVCYYLLRLGRSKIPYDIKIVDRVDDVPTVKTSKRRKSETDAAVLLKMN